MGNDNKRAQSIAPTKETPKFIIANNRYTTSVNNEKNEFSNKRKRFRNLVSEQITKRTINQLKLLNLFEVSNEVKNNKVIGNLTNTSTSSNSHKTNHYENEIIEKSINNNDTILRKKYFQKIVNSTTKKNLESKRSSQNIFIFDWDDTIMCTTFITPRGYFTESNLVDLEEKKDVALFSKLEDIIVKILSYAITKGETYIITNAASGWVEYSSKMLFPKVLPILKKITIISARGWFEKEFPRNSKLWKISCFEEIGKIYNHTILTNLIVVGDSLIEMEAAYSFAKYFIKYFIKTVKLKEAPTPLQLFKQLTLLNNDLDKIVNQQSSLAILIKKNNESKKHSRVLSNLSQNNKSFKDKRTLINVKPSIEDLRNSI